MKKILFIAILICSLSLFARTVNISENAGKPVFQTISSNSEETIIQFNLDKYDLKNITDKGKTFTKIEYDKTSGEQYENGKPYLPNIGKFVALPDRGLPEIEVISYEYDTINDILLYPRQNDSTDKNDFYIDDNFYKKDTDYPLQIATIQNPVIIRNYRLSAFTINPFQYNPAKKSLKIYKNIKLKITYKHDKTDINPLTTHKKRSKIFENVLKNMIVNFDFTKNRDEEYQQPGLLVIYYNNSNLAQLVNILIDWKKAKGFNVISASTSTTGTSFSQIKSYIQNIYNNSDNPPEYLMLVGDAQSGGYRIPTSSYGGGAGDINYTLLEGNDILGDMFVGRLSVSTQSEMQTVLSKILKYEKTPYMDNTEWYKKAALIGDPSSSGQSTIYTNLFIKQIINDTNPNYSFYEEYSGGFVSAMSSALNNGVLYFNYRGWYGMSNWDTGDVYSLHNGYKLPMVLAITCGTGDFDQEDSMNEVFLTAGTPTNPKGGIAAIATATIHTHTCFNNIVDAGFYQAVFKENITQPGAALTRAKYALYLAYPQNPSNHVTQFSYWNNLMGDPSLELWTNEPNTMNIDFPSTVQTGTNTISIHCYDNNRMNLKDVWVTAKSGNDILDTGFTDNEGNILLHIDANNPGTINLTATKHNFLPLLNDINISTQSTNVSIVSTEIDDSQGNNDNQINPGEDISLNIHLKNFGSNTASGVSATISTQSDKVDILNGSSSYQDIPTGQEVAANTPFTLHFHNDILDGEKISFQIDITTDANIHTDYITLEINSALLISLGYTLVGNSYLDPGETADMYVTLKNIGSVAANNLQGELISNDTNITVLNSTGGFGNINPNFTGNNANETFQIQANDSLIPGMIIPLQLHLTNSDGFAQTLSIGVQIGNPGLHDPVGPDTFGHFIYDDADNGYEDMPFYQWIELDPANGGNGTSLNFSDSGNMGYVSTVDLPITFNFYGKQYDTITISSDGWLSPGSHEQPAFMNWPIPGPLAPQPLIAVFWDDLKKQGSSSKIFYHYNAAENIFIVEWKSMRNEYNNSEETFEAILYDANTYPAAHLESKIKFQYKVINNVDAGSYGGYEVSHGQYATVGIQDENGLKGLQYTFNNSYPTAAKHLQNNMALMISGGAVSQEQVFLVLNETSFEDNFNHNNQPDFGERVNMFINLHNLGQTMATNVNATITANDPYITLYNNTSAYNNINGESYENNLQPFVFDVANNVPDGHTVNFSIHITSDQGNWDYTSTVRLNSVNLQITSYSVANDDNSDGLLNPGESADIIFNIHNSGGAPETNLDFEISSTNNFISFENGNFEISHIYGEYDFGIVYHVTISSSIQNQTVVPINFSVSGDNNFNQTLSTQICIGSTTEDFESGTFDVFPWSFPQEEWIIDNTVHHSGSYSAKSNDINDNQYTTMQITVNLTSPSQVSFYRKVSCEDDGYDGYDRLEFYIDNSEQDRWGGERPWEQFTYNVPAGSHTLKWIYRKDALVSEGQDCAWIDDIELPGVSNPITDPVMMLSYTSLEETLAPNNTIVDTIDITNIGGGVLIYTAQIQNTNPDFISIENVSGNLSTGETAHLSVNISSENLAFGEYHGEILISDNRTQTTIPVTLIVADVDENQDQIPAVNELYHAYPNPFYASKQKSGVTIKFALKQSNITKLDIFNLKGQKVKSLVNKELKAGIHKIIWDGKNNQGKTASSGIYFYRIQSGKFTKFDKMIVIK